MNTNSILLLCKLVSCASAKKFIHMSSIFIGLREHEIEPDKIYESLLQLSLFNGFPSTIESLKLFKENFPEYTPSNEQYNVNLFEKRGIINCEMVYGANFTKLQQNITKLSPDLSEWMIIEGYGKVMGRPGLSMQEREILNVAMLCTNYAGEQLHSHIKGALNTGSDYQLIKEAINTTSKYNTPGNITKALKLLRTTVNKSRTK